MTYTYERIWDGSGDSIGWALSDGVDHAAFILEHPDDGPVVVAIPQEPGHGAPCWSVHQCRDVDDAARNLSRRFDTDARPTGEVRRLISEQPTATDLLAQLHDVQEQLARACEAIDECMEEYAILDRCCGDWSERCGNIETALRECAALAETGDCGAIAIAIEAALGESTDA